MAAGAGGKRGAAVVALLAIGPIIYFGRPEAPVWTKAAMYLVGLLGAAVVGWAVWRSKTESKELREMEAELAGAPAGAPEKSLETVGSGV